MSANGSMRSSPRPRTSAERQIVVRRAAPRFRPVDRETCQQQVYGKLRDAFMKGQFMPGDVITLRGIAEELGTSLTPVREALRQLLAEQALEVGVHRKVRVPVATRQTLEELRRVRVLLEGMLTEQASSRIDVAAVEKLEALSTEMVSVVGRHADAKKYLEKNQAFHFGIYRAAESPIALRIVENLWLQIGPSFNLLLLNGSLPNLAAKAVGGRGFLWEHHQAIVQAIREKRYAGARKAMEADISAGMRFLIGCI